MPVCRGTATQLYLVRKFAVALKSFDKSMWQRYNLKRPLGASFVAIYSGIFPHLCGFFLLIAIMALDSRHLQREISDEQSQPAVTVRSVGLGLFLVVALDVLAICVRYVFSRFFNDL